MVDKSLRTGLIISGGVVLAVFLAGMISPFVTYEPADEVDVSRALSSPTWEFILGTDYQGRGIGMRLFKGVEAFFLPGLFAAGLAVVIGSLAGATAGYARGAVRASVLGVLQLIDTLPRLVFIILVCTIMEPTIYLIAFFAGILFVPAIATPIRRRVETLGSEDYILAYLAHGFRPVKILLYHILWLQCRPMMIRQASYVFAYVLFVETALSYLGDYGVQEPNPSWGNMIAQAKELPVGSVAWPWITAAVAVVLTIAGFLAFGNLLARRDEQEAR